MNLFNLFNKPINRKEYVLSKCGCICYCPHCKDILNDNSEWISTDDDGEGTYICNECKTISRWHFSIAPCPVLL